MWELLAGLFVGTLISGLVPIVNAELLVVGAAAVVPGIGVPLVAVVSTLGQMVTKTALFGLARWAPSRLPDRARAALERASRAVSARGGAASSLVLTSAAVGFPPFYGVSLACGALGMRTGSFVLSGGVGRLVRFGALAWAGSQLGSEGMELVTAGLVPAVKP